MFYQGYMPLVRIVVLGTLGYIGLIILLRISGKRTLSKMNAFDLIITITFGSTFATLLLNKDVVLVEGLTAFAMLVGLQFVVAWLSTHSGTVRNLVKDEPRLLMYRGEMLHDALRQERVPPEEVLAAMRNSGVPGPESAEAVVLETDGTFSVVPRRKDKPEGALHGVVGMDRQTNPSSKKAGES